MAKTRPYLQIAIIAIVALFVVFIPAFSRLLTDYWWFKAVGMTSLFMVPLKTSVMLFFAGALIFLVFAGVNVRIASQKSKNQFTFLEYGFIVLFAIINGLFASSQWFTLKAFFNQVPFGLTDPIFSNDIAFYVFSLPFYDAVLNFALTAIVFTTILVALNYFQSVLISFFQEQSGQQQTEDGNTVYMQNKNHIKKAMRALKRKAGLHLSLLVSLFFFAIAAKHYLGRFSILNSQSGVVPGAGYTDVNAILPALNVLIFVAIIVGILFIIIGISRGLDKTYLLYAAAAYVILSFVGLQIIPGIMQSLVVSPNELSLERPYLEHGINYTRHAYDLYDVEVKDFNVKTNLTREIIEKSPETINNARILDMRPLIETYKQTQEIRLYYDLSSIDIDRYQMGDDYRQVLTAPRELNQDSIADKAKTWVNLHMIYTHGFGLVMSPVNKVTEEGLPKYLIQDVPPRTSGIANNLSINQPRLYYSQQDNEYVFVNSEVEEFDYPKGDENAMTHYDGEGGIKMDSLFKRIMFAIRFGDVRILTTSSITDETRGMFDRQIKQRVQKLTPFINLDRDPYMVLHDGKLSWIIDGYTTTSRYPYSEMLGKFNYISNSVKATVDAYDGTVRYFMPGEKDPLIKTYDNIFPEVFEEIDEMPDNLQDHIRYPIDLFEIQSELYKDYHMTNPDVFYNREDAWELPTEIYGQGQKTKVKPYYNIMRLPGEDKEEFALLNTFTPIRKDNMIAWFAGRSDGEEYGDLILFRFPKDKLVYGPFQIEAKIDQHPEISQQISLWDQQGSHVTRGNLLVLPMGESMLYIEPLYIEAESGQLPSLKRILLSDGERVVMEKSVGEALDALFGEKAEGDSGDGTLQPLPSDLARDAQTYYQKMRDAASAGNWSAYGEYQQKLGATIEQMRTDATGP